MPALLTNKSKLYFISLNLNIKVPCRHCERSEAISFYTQTIDCFVVPPRNDDVVILR